MRISAFFALFLVGCSGISVPEEFSYQEIKTEKFTLASWQKSSKAGDSLNIYIEGDGAAFTRFGTPSSNPTPKGTLVRELAFGDKAPEVIYIARPCQFVTDGVCSEKYWTTARFSPEVISSFCTALKQIGENRSLTLIGYSGGAMIAGLAALNCPELKVRKVITVAGNLDHKSWTTFHGDTPLHESLNLADSKEAFADIPQHHFIGEDDDIIPPFLTLNVSPDKQNITVVKGAGHASGWQKAFPQIYKELPF